MTASSGSRRWLHWVLGVATIALLAIFARHVEWQRTWTAVVHADPMVLAVATVANLASLLVKGVRWSLFLGAAGVSGVAPAVRATVAGAALNNVLVANGGDAARVASLTRRAGKSSASVIATLVVDRACDLVTYIALFVVAAFVLPVPAELARWRTPAAAALAGALGIVVAIVWRASRPTSPTRHDTTHGLGAKIRDYWRRLVSTTSAVATPTRVGVAVAMSLVAWAAQWATFHYAARASHFGVTATMSLLALLVVNASFVIRLTPGNVGVFQLLYALATTPFGLNRDDAVAAAVLISAVQYIPVTLVGLLVAPTLVQGGTQERAAAAPAEQRGNGQTAVVTPGRTRMRGDSKLGT